MRICIPVLDDQGHRSQVCAHFGSAPAVMIVDTESGECRAIVNGNEHHAHGMCQPLAAIAGERVDGIVVGGIGMGALMKLEAAGVHVYRATHATVGETVEAFKAGTLSRVEPHQACGHHAHHH